jgi:hypothetical protein
MNPPVKPEGVAMTGWLCAVAGGLTIITGMTFGMAGALARALSRQEDDLLAQATQALDPLSRALLDHFEVVAATLVAFGLASLIIGVQFLRLRPSARVSLEILAWVVLIGTLVLEALAVAFPLREKSVGAPPSWISDPLTSMLLSLVQIVVCVMVIRFVRSPAVRAAFRRGAANPR